MTERRANCLGWIVIGALPLAGLLCGLIGTYRSMAEFRTRITPGMSVTELHSFAGPPGQVIRRGEPLQWPERSDTAPALDEHMAVHLYRREGLPYWNAYVLIDERQSEVIRSEVAGWW